MHGFFVQNKKPHFLGIPNTIFALAPRALPFTLFTRNDHLIMQHQRQILSMWMSAVKLQQLDFTFLEQQLSQFDPSEGFLCPSV